MQIGKIYASNVMRLRLAEITLNGNSLIVAGKNEQGKSSFLNTFLIILGGKKVTPSQVVTRGAEKAEIYLDLTEDFRIEKVITGDQMELRVIPLDPELAHVKYTSPQDICNKLFGELTFDPLEFQFMEPKEQVVILQKFLPPGIDLKAIDNKIAMKYDLRTSVNKDHKKNDLKFKSMKQPIPNLPNKEISILELSKQKDILQLKQKAFELKDKNKKDLADSVVTLALKIGNNKALAEAYLAALTPLQKLDSSLLQIQSIAKTIRSLQEDKDGFAMNVDKYEKELATNEKSLKEFTFGDSKDVTNEIAKLDKDIEEAEQKNKDIRYRNEYSEAENAAGTAKVKSDSLTLEIEALRADKLNVFKEANLPVPGLTFNEEGVFFEDLPFEQLSESKRIMISLKIGMALNPTLKTMFTKRGNDIDDDRLRDIFAIAELEGYQLIIERINPLEGLPYIVISDGYVIEDNSISTPIPPKETVEEKPKVEPEIKPEIKTQPKEEEDLI